MSKDSYDVSAIELESITKLGTKFEILVLSIPEDEVEDKLTFLSKHKGRINRTSYEDFLIAHCVANINQLIAHINNNLSNNPDVMTIREELIGKIIILNPKLDPEGLVLNKNFVVRPKGKRIKSDEVRLVENPHWDENYPVVTSEEQQEEVKQELKDVADEKSKDINDLKFEAQQIWWKRIGQYIKIKKFSETDAENILKKRYFHSTTSFNTFIVSVCVIDFEDLFLLLDNMGIPNRVAPPILMNELYELCKSANPFLTYEKAQELSGEPASEEDHPVQQDEGQRKSFRTATSRAAQAKKKPGKKFKDVPKEDLLNLADNMKIFLVGQDEAVDTLSNAIQRASIGLKDPLRPIGSFLFAGRTGVGKTLATKVLADELIKSRDNLITIDCSEYSADHEYAKLIGAPAGYIGHEQGGHLTNAVAKNPFCVVVFDEVEKASHKVHELMLQILEEGRLTDGRGQMVSFKDAVIIMTSNVGVQEIDCIQKTIGFGDVSKITDEKKDKALNEALKKKFKPEFLNRLDEIIFFKNLTKENYMKIIDIELHKLNENLKNNDTEYKTLNVVFDKEVKDYIYENGIDEKYGARPLKRCIEKSISTPLAKKILSENINPESVIRVTLGDGEVTFLNHLKSEEKSVYLTEEFQVGANGN